MSLSLGSFRLITQADRRHHVANLKPVADAVVMLSLETPVLDIIRVSLISRNQVVQECTPQEILSINRPEFTSLRLPFGSPGLSLSKPYIIVVETEHSWQSIGQILAINAFDTGSFPFAKMPEPDITVWRPRKAPPVEVPSNEAELYKMTKVVKVQDGLNVPLPFPVLLERISVGEGKPTFHLMLDGRISEPSQGGCIVVDDLQVYAGLSPNLFPLPYSGKFSLAGNPPFAQNNRSLSLAGVDGKGAWLRFREPLDQNEIELTLTYWKVK